MCLLACLACLSSQRGGARVQRQRPEQVILFAPAPPSAPQRARWRLRCRARNSAEVRERMFRAAGVALLGKR